MRFSDRREAGIELAGKLLRYRNTDAIVLALPRGGVPVAFEVARALGLPLDLMLVRKLGVPGHEELAMGAIANGDVAVFNEALLNSLRIPQPIIAEITDRERQELERRNARYRSGAPAPELRGRTVILVDDGIATGADMRAAAEAARRQGAARVVVAAPVAAQSSVAMLRATADEVVVVAMPEPFFGVGAHYGNFAQTSDAEVSRLLSAARPQPTA